MTQLAKLGEMLSEDSHYEGDGKRQGFAMTAEEARGEIAALRADKDFMSNYMSEDKLMPARKQAIEKMQRLMAIAYPE